jgi:hypothetical protein
MQPEVRVRVFAHDRELRAWLVDELALISPTIDVQTIDVLDATGVQLLVVGLEALTAVDVERLCELVDATAVIAIGVPTARLASARFACVLDDTLTSKQLKRAVRETLASPHPASPVSRA